MKRSAREQNDGNFHDREKDEGFGEWITATSPEDLFKFNVDFQLLEHKSLMINDDDTHVSL